MTAPSLARRLRRLRVVSIAGARVPVAEGPRARLLGLAHLERREAGPGLLIPSCRSVHTFGMRFELDVVFLDGTGLPRSVHRRVPSRRLLVDWHAAAVLELPSDA